MSTATGARRDRRPVAALLAAQTVALVGNVVFAIAIPLHVLATTGSAALTGVMAVATTAPVIIGGTVGGVLVDRLGYRRSSIVSDIIGGATTVAIPILAWTVGLPLWGLFGLVFAAGLLDTPGQTARTSLLPEASARAGLSLESSTGWNGAADRGSRLIGAPIAAGLVLLMSPLSAVALTSVTFAASALVVWALVPRDLETHRPTDGTGSAPAMDQPAAGFWSEFREGLQWMWRDRLMRALTLMIVVTNAFDAAKYSVILPVYATDTLANPATLGVLVGAHAVGALVSTLLFGAFGRRMPRRWTFAVGFLLAGGPVYFVLAARSGLVWCVVSLVVAGLASGAINPVLSTVFLERVPPRMRARAGGVMTAGCWAGMPIGALAAGVTVQHIGVVTTLVIIGSAYVAVTLAPFWPTPWRSLDRGGAEVASAKG